MRPEGRAVSIVNYGATARRFPTVAKKTLEAARVMRVLDINTELQATLENGLARKVLDSHCAHLIGHKPLSPAEPVCCD